MMNFKRFYFAIALVLFFVSAHSQVGNYYSRWKFDGDFSDSGIGGNNGIAVGNPVFVSDKDGNASSALRFDGVNDYVRVAHNDSLSLINDYTVSFWIKPSTFGQGGFGRIIEKRDNSVGAGKGWSINLDQSNTGLRVNKIGSTSAMIPNCVELNQWQMFSISHDGDTLRVYKNGQIINTRSFPTFVPTSVEALIGQTESGGKLFNGDIDDIMVYTKVLTSSEIASLYTPKLDNYYSRWKFDGDFTDSGIGGNNGTAVGNPIFVSDKDGNASSALRFDGVNDYVRIAHDNDLSLTSNYTVNFWIKPSTFGQGGFGRIIEKRDNSVGSGKGWAINLDQNNNGLRVNKIGSTSAMIPNCVILNQWQMFSITHDGDTLRVYKDGQIIDTRTYPTFVLTTVEALIGQTESGGRLFNGDIADITVYKRDLNSAEIEGLYTPQSNDYYSRWKFDGDFTDSGIGSNNGTAVGNPVFVSDKDGNASSAVRLDGVNDYVRIAHDGSLSLTNDYTVSFWIKPSTFGQGGFGRIIEKRDNSVGSGKGWAINLDQNNNGLRVNKIGSTSAMIPNCIILNQWQMFSITHDGDTLRVYKDGQIIDTRSYPTFVSTTVEALIGQTESGGRLFNGDIGDITVYQRVLNSLEIGALFSNPQMRVLKSAFSSNDIRTEDNKDILSIYPNPSNGSFSIKFALELEEEAQIKIFDTKGMLIRELVTAQNTNQINLDDVVSGVYFVKIYLGNRTVTNKIIIK